MAKLSQEQYKARFEREKQKRDIIEQKKELARKKKELAEAHYEKKYKDMVGGDQVRAKLIDIQDLDDLIVNIESTGLENQYEEYPDLEEFEKYRKSLLPDEKNIHKSGVSKRNFSEKQLQYLNKQNSDIKTYFNLVTPKYNVYICSCCGLQKPLDEFHKAWSLLYANKIDINGQLHVAWCKDCAKKLFEYYYRKYECNAELAMERFCCDTNTYWDIDFFKIAQTNMVNNNMQSHIVSEYISAIGKPRIYGRTYWDSPTIKNRNITIVHGENNELETKLVYDPDVLTLVQAEGQNNILSPNSVEKSINPDAPPLNWSKEDAQNKLKVIKIVGYDPWDYLDGEDRKVLYKDFLNILELGMENDFTKLQAAIQIVGSFFKVRQMEKEMNRMRMSGAPTNDLKNYSALLAAERKAISDFTKDQGFSERYSAAKAKGENTLSGMMAKMNNNQYEKILLNAYDIETSKSMQQVADMSFQAVMKQIGFSEAEAWQICQEQLNRLNELQKELDRTKEDLRLANYQLAEYNLKIEAKKRGESDD